MLEDSKAFIAMQGPLLNTIHKFWRLIFSKGIKLIVMLCKIEEDCRVNKLIYFRKNAMFIGQLK